MATADVSEKTENEVETVEPSLNWDASVPFRSIGIGWNSEAVVVDWDGQGVPALLIIASEGRTARIYRPKNEGNFPRPYDAGTLVEGFDGLRCLCVLPNGSETRFDLVGLSEAGLVYLKNEGSRELPEFGSRELLGLSSDLGLGASRISQITAVDWDGDGNIDLLIGVDHLDGYWPNDSTIPIEQQVGFNQKGSHPAYDGQGLWRGKAPEPRLVWLKNLGAPGNPRFELQPAISGDSGTLDLAQHPAPLAVSWYGGDNLELLLSDARGLVKVYRNFGGQRPPVLMDPRTLKAANTPLVLPEYRTTVIAADLDNDRRTELIYGTSHGRVYAVRATSRDSASLPQELLQEPGSLWLGGHAVVAAGDLDNDGGLDLVYGDGPGHLWWVKDLGQGTEHRYALPVPVEAGGVPFRLEPGPDGLLGGPVAPRSGYACPILADWTGNGRLDLLVSGASGEVLFLRNDGSVTQPRFSSPMPVRCEGAPLILPPRVRPAVADWNGTGKLDLIALDLQGFLCVYPALDERTLGEPVPLVGRLGRVIRLDGGFGLAGKCSLWAGPWTGSEQMDILVGLPADSAQFILPALTGRAWAENGAWPTVLLLENQGRNGLIARPISTLDGQPLVIGVEGCSPSGVRGNDSGALDLLVGSDDGHVHYYRRDQLRW